MKYIDEFRHPVLVQQILRTASRRWTLMDVCGGQTHGLLRYGIAEALQARVELLHGPGCPVCVTPVEAIDFAQKLAMQPGVILTSFGDMLRVPGRRGSLLDVRARGGNVRIVYSPLDAVELARTNSERQVVFFAVGFETTAPATALAVLQAQRLGLDNFSLIVSHVRVVPAMRDILNHSSGHVQCFLAAGHVCTVTGTEEHIQLCKDFGVPIVVAGFEPLDLLQAILTAVEMLENGQVDLVNAYSRYVRAAGNKHARATVEKVYAVADRQWRGIGRIASGGLELRSEYRQFDAYARFSSQIELPVIPDGDCRSGEVMAGKIKPHECPHFLRGCTVEHPLGAPMVSGEGACAAYARYSPSPSNSPNSQVCLE
jgi:hydrogenase expression/formation protein HypD